MSPAVEPQPLTAEAHALRGRLRRRGELYWVGEDHTGDTKAENTLVAPRLDRRRVAIDTASGHDFYSSPRLSPDGAPLAGSAGTTRNAVGRHRAVGRRLTRRLGRAQPCKIAGGPDESIFQPEWLPTARSISSPTGPAGGTSTAGRGRQSNPPVRRRPSSALPHGYSALRSLRLRADRTPHLHATTRRPRQLRRPGHRDPDATRSGPVHDDLRSARRAGDRVVFHRRVPDRDRSVVSLDLTTGELDVLRRSRERTSTRRTSLGAAGDRVSDRGRPDRACVLLSAAQRDYARPRTRSRRCSS